MKITRKEAATAGYLIDDHRYPPVAYSGPRFRPDVWFETFTELESELMKQLAECKTRLEIFTCHTCLDSETCEYAWDDYNTGGSCLAEK